MNANPKHHSNTPAIPQPFAPATLIQPHADGIQIIIASAPQVSTVIALSLDQLKGAMEACLKLRQSQNDPGALRAMMSRKEVQV